MFVAYFLSVFSFEVPVWYFVCGMLVLRLHWQLFNGFGDFGYLVILVGFYCLTLLLALALIVFCVVLDWYFSALTVSFAVLRVVVWFGCLTWLFRVFWVLLLWYAATTWFGFVFALCSEFWMCFYIVIMVVGCCLGLLFERVGWTKVARGDYFTVSLVDSGYGVGLGLVYDACCFWILFMILGFRVSFRLGFTLLLWFVRRYCYTYGLYLNSCCLFVWWWFVLFCLRLFVFVFSVLVCVFCFGW